MIHLKQEDQPEWVERYRPNRVKDCILPKGIKSTFQNFVDKELIPNMMLIGQPGIGKTTIAKAMLDELGCDYIVINGSLEGRQIDTVRTTIVNFASSKSLYGGRKYIIIDEADYLNAESVQPALRNLTEDFSKNCGFILTANYVGKIIEPLASRFPSYEFKIPKDEKENLAKQFFLRAKEILDNEHIEYDAKAIAALITKFFPDWRRVIGELQRYSSNGKIDSGILSNLTETNIKQVIGYLKEKNFSHIRKWVAENEDMSDVNVMREIYNRANDVMESSSIPQLILHISKYQYQSAFAVDKSINLMAFFVEVMVDCKWK